MKQQIKTRKISFIMIALFICLFCLGTGPVTARAESIHSVSETAENAVFITFKKGASDERGKYLGVSFFFPNEYYESEYEYGIAVFPEKFIARYELYGDYISRKETDGIAISVLTGNGGTVENGRLSSYNVTKIPDSSLNMRLVFVLFVRDSDGEIAYKEPVVSSFNEAVLEEPTTEELLKLAGERQKEIAMNGQFANIVNRLSELIDSVWIYLVIGMASVVIVWGAYIGIRVAIAKKNEEKINAKEMMKHLVIGILVMFVFAVGLPLLIKGLSVWAV